MINSWFSFAREDLIMAETALKQGIYNQVCFHAQQGAEKTLKGFLRSKEQVVPRTHSLGDLIELCRKINSEFKELESSCAIVDRYYIPTRYPDALAGMLPDGLPEKDDAEEAVSILKEVMDFVNNKP